MMTSSRGIRRARRLLAFAALVMLGVGSGGAAVQAQAQAPKMSVGLPGIPPVFVSAQVLVADKQGFFKKYGVDVDVRLFDTGTAASRAVVSGDIDAALSPSPLVIGQISNADADFTAVYGMEHPDWQLASLDPDASCQTIAGKPVGVDTPGGARSIALKMMLAACDSSIAKVQQVALAANTPTALIAGQIKYAVLHLDDVAIVEQQSGKSLKIITTAASSMPVDHYMMIVAGRGKLARNRDGYVRMVAGLIAAEAFMRDPANRQAVAKIATATGHSEAEAAQALDGYLAMEFWPHGSAGLAQANIEAVIKAQATVGNILPGKTPAAYARIADPSVWRDAAALVESRP